MPLPVGPGGQGRRLAGVRRRPAQLYAPRATRPATSTATTRRPAPGPNCEPWPVGVEAKPPYKGSVGCADGDRPNLRDQGQQHPGLLALRRRDQAWTQLADVPLGTSPTRRSRAATDLVYVDEGESTATCTCSRATRPSSGATTPTSGSWHSLPDAPAGALAKWDKGSWLALGRRRRIYAHKAKNHELYAFDLAAGTWGPALTGMPLLNTQTGKSKKSKDGGCGAALGDALYALKGGNTQDFYALDLGTMAWTENDTMPAFGSTAKKKRVKAGADIVTDGEVLYALKGNKTLEFWRYVPEPDLQPTLAAATGRNGSAGRRQKSECRMQIADCAEPEPGHR